MFSFFFVGEWSHGEAEDAVLDDESESSVTVLVFIFASTFCGKACKPFSGEVCDSVTEDESLNLEVQFMALGRALRDSKSHGAGKARVPRRDEY
jgi:hypothetical protein